MTVLASVLGYAGVGFLARCYALGIQKRNVFENLGGHAAFMTAFGAVGYYFHGLEGRQNEMIARKKAQILENRRRLAETLESRNGNENNGGEEGDGEEA